MKNNECTIYIVTKRGYTQSYRREKKGWAQTCPDGKVRPLSAEQLLSHILPSLAGISPSSVRVEPDKQKKYETAPRIPKEQTLRKKQKRENTFSQDDN